MEIKASELWSLLASLVALITFSQTLLQSLLPPPLQDLIFIVFYRMTDYFTSYCFIEVPEYDKTTSNELYSSIKLYLSKADYTKAKRLKLCRGSNSKGFLYSPSNNEKVPMSFGNAKVWWEHHTLQNSQQAQQHYGWPYNEQRMYILKIHKKDRERVLSSYMDHILKQAREFKAQNREKLLFTNSSKDHFYNPWDSVTFSHPSTFHTLALLPSLKAQIMADLQAFANGEKFYKNAGRAWKRGYLLHGPPGTGKSSLIAAMANFLHYDVYDLELTQVSSNAELRMLLRTTTHRSIIVIEDIDCSLNFTTRGKKKKSTRKKSRNKGDHGGHDDDADEDEDDGGSTMTLSGLLNFTDGLWSCSGDERIFVFTTNHMDKLDPALLRSGRMDMHIHMSYCSFPAFKILARNYLGLEDHHLLPQIEEIIEDGAHDIIPAQASEILIRNRDDPTAALEQVLNELRGHASTPPPAAAEELIHTEPSTA